MEDSTPAPQKQQCCSDPKMEDMDERTQMCQNCGTQVRQNIENNTAEELKTCGASLKRKKGQFCRSKPGRDGLCWRHSKQPFQQEDEDNTPIGGKILVKATMKELREIAKKEGLKGYSRKPKGDWLS